MPIAVFIYEQIRTKIEFKVNEKFKDICKKYSKQSNINLNSVYFLYGGNKINLELTYGQIVNKRDTNANEIEILVFQIEEPKEEKTIINSKNIICPECGENIRINIKDNLIDLYGCKNGHSINNILLDEFESTQNIDLTKIICYKCRKNKSDTYNNEFFLDNSQIFVYTQYL